MFRIEKLGDVAVLIATKRIEGRQRVTAREQVDGLLETGVTKLVLDLSLLDRIDSSGLASVVAAYRRAQSVHGDLCLCGLGPRVRSVFEIALLNSVIPIYTDRDQAINHFKDPSARPDAEA
jgi:anti-anti-sigma factor